MFAIAPTSSESLPDRATETILLSLGSNIEPDENLPWACSLLAMQIEILAVSRVFETAPAGIGDQTHFLNAAIEVCSNVTARELKYEIVRPVERQLGRRRTADRNAPRTIDVDISLIGERVFEDRSAGILIPDPEILTRAHVAVPLADVAPERLHPVSGERLREIAARLDDRGIQERADLDLLAQKGLTTS